MVAQHVSHPVHGRGVIRFGGSHTRYTTVRFESDMLLTLPTSELIIEKTAVFVAGDRIALDNRQGTIKSVQYDQAHVAWDDTTESYTFACNPNLTPLPPLPAGAMVKHKWSVGLVGRMAQTPTRGKVYGAVTWNNGLMVNVKLETLAPLHPQETKRTVDSALAEIRTEIAKWRTVEQEAEEKVRLLTEQATVLLDAKRHSELVQSIEKW